MVRFLGFTNEKIILSMMSCYYLFGFLAYFCITEKRKVECKKKEYIKRALKQLEKNYKKFCTFYFFYKNDKSN